MTNKARIALIFAALIAMLVAGPLISDRAANLDEHATAEYVGGAKCVSCHQQQHQSFVGSHHDLAMDVANSTTVRAKFDGSTLEHYGVTSTFFTQKNKFMVNTEGPDGALQDFEVKYVFGYEPLQQYLVELVPPGNETGLGQYQVLRLSWDTQNNRWFYLSPPDVDEKVEPGDPLHWTGISQRWNTSCASCHSTNLKKNFDVLTGKYSTSFSDIDVNCEACHGPGSLHVQIVSNRWWTRDPIHGLGLVSLKAGDSTTQIESCAPCHSRRTELCSGFTTGERYDDYFSCSMLTDQIYHQDGQIRDEVYVYGSFIQSKMYHQGIKCTDCHDPHSAKVKFDNNLLCTSCHQHPAGKYDSISHHRHPVGSTGALCVECHMPETVYMDVDARRDHSLRVPRPDLSVRFGTPNACTGCHLDEQNLPEPLREELTQYLDWIIAAENGTESVQAELQKTNKQMADAFADWYPDFNDNPNLSHYYEQLVVGKSGPDTQFRHLAELSADKKAPAIFRASAIDAMSESSSVDSIPMAISACDDQDAKVVTAAVRLLGQRFLHNSDQISSPKKRAELDPMNRKIIRMLQKMLDHESRLVRIETARIMANIPPQLLSRYNANAAFDDNQTALNELLDSLKLTNDTGGSHAVLGSIAEARGRWEKAADHYRNAISVDPWFTGPRSNLAALLERRTDQIRDQIIRKPGSPESATLGKRIDHLQSESKRLRRQEYELLKIEVERAGDLPAHGLFYRFGLAAYLMNDHEAAEENLSRANQLAPEIDLYAIALASYYIERQKFNDALVIVEKLIESEPENPSYQSLKEEILKSFRNHGIEKIN